MKTHKLKIKKEFYDLIVKGIKKYECRKINKNYIKAGDIIEYVDLETERRLGEAKVCEVYVLSPYEIAELLFMGEVTIEFVKKHYLEKEEEILVFHIINIDTHLEECYYCNEIDDKDTLEWRDCDDGYMCEQCRIDTR
jgi:predicted transcriptional regulator